MTALLKAILRPALRFYLRAIQTSARTQVAYLRRGQFVKAGRGCKIYLYILANLLASPRLVPRRRDCEFCGWSGFSFMPAYYVDCYRADVFCPNCRLMDRYRTLIHFMRQSERGAKIHQMKPRVLEVAPTESSRAMLAKEFNARKSIGFDLSNRWADVKGDLQAMPFPDASFDVFLCYEVLDYIPLDDLALLELKRVLEPGGCGILRVGFDEQLPATIDYAKPDADDSYHIRRYGRDLSDRFRKAGFIVELVNLVENVSEDDRERLGLDTYPVFFLQPATQAKTKNV